MRSGIFYVSNKYSKANNKYLESYDYNKPSKFITNLDANFFYELAMSQYL